MCKYSVSLAGNIVSLLFTMSFLSCDLRSQRYCFAVKNAIHKPRLQAIQVALGHLLEFFSEIL